ncbi:MAG: haloacid dehalogenase-like hydrolase [Verrucomicrobiota bacterium]|nr:haloacid dehalogenase-like hydrolase [Verrucomicrobiota bacterium]
MTNQKRLLLWDVDATLVTTLRAGVKALQGVVRERFGADDAFDDIEIAGRTDAMIAMAILRKYHVESAAENVRSFLDSYLEHLAEFLPQLQGRVLPGVREILERLHSRPDRVLALLTGNLRSGAELKLRRYELWHFFEFGAFADDHHDRNELGTFARQRAQEKHGHDFASGAIDVIGDTGHDVAAGRAIGARTIAVATGTWPRERLALSQPDFLFDDLSDVDRVMDTLGW